MPDLPITGLGAVASGDITNVASAFLAIVDGDTKKIDLDVLQGLLGGGGVSYVQTRRTITQSIPNNSWTLVDFNVEDNDPGGYFDTNSTGMFFIPNNDFSEARVWLFATWQLNQNQGRYIRIDNLGGTTLVNAIQEAQAEAGQMIATRRMSISSGDAFNFRVLQNSGVNGLRLSGSDFGGSTYAYMELYV